MLPDALHERGCERARSHVLKVLCGLAVESILHMQAVAKISLKRGLYSHVGERQPFMLMVCLVNSAGNMLSLQEKGWFCYSSPTQTQFSLWIFQSGNSVSTS